MKPNTFVTRLMTVTVAATLCGVPELVQAQTSAAPQQAASQQEQSQPNAQQAPAMTTEQQAPQQNGQGTPGMIDPSKGPLAPVPSSTDQELPNAPSAQQQPPASQGGNQAETIQQAPAGTAAAPAGPTAGGAASKPAGNAIAPAKQRQVRSLLIKLGAVAAAGIAIGTVAALSRGTSSKPPGAK